MKDADLIARHIAGYGVVRIEAHEGTAPDDSPADYELHIRIKNGRILAAMRRAGIGSGAELARRARVATAEVYNLLNGNVPAATADYRRRDGEAGRGAGQWRRTALRVAAALKLPVESLFTERQKHHGVRHNHVVRKVAEAEVDAVLDSLTAIKSPDEIAVEHELQTLVARALETLKPRTAQVLRARFGLDGAGPMTYSQTAKLIAPASYCGPGAGSGITKERVRQIEQKALRFLRHPSRSRGLRQFLPEIEQFDDKPLGGAP